MMEVIKKAEKITRVALRYKLSEEQVKGILEITNGDVDKAVRMIESTATIIAKFQ